MLEFTLLRSTLLSALGLAPESVFPGSAVQADATNNKAIIITVRLKDISSWILFLVLTRM
jgi:hypothetical protein